MGSVGYAEPVTSVETVASAWARELVAIAVLVAAAYAS